MQKIKLIIIAFLTLLLLSCADVEKNGTGKGKIAVTILPYKYLVEKIGGGAFDVKLSIPPGSSPHHFEPSPKTVKEIAEADLYLKVGAGLDFEDVWIKKLKGVSNSLEVVDLSEGVRRIDRDPHIWLGLNNLKIISANVKNVLSTIEPAKKEIFEENHRQFVDSLDIIHQNLINSFSGLENRILFTYHSAWEYFADEYNFIEISIEKGNKKPNPRGLKRLSIVVKDKNIPVIFSDPQHGTKPAETIAGELNIAVDIINPLPHDLLGNFYHVQQKILQYYQ